MNANTSFIEPLLERTQEYSKTSFELLKLKSLDKTADLGSTLISRMLFIVVISIFSLTLNIALALWLGDVLGRNYFGFLVVAFFYGVIGIGLLLAHPSIKKRVSNSIIVQILN
jgi:hypothetical protein